MTGRNRDRSDTVVRRSGRPRHGRRGSWSGGRRCGSLACSKASRSTSRDALEALALAMVPALEIDFAVQPTAGGHVGDWTARVHNVSQRFAASDVVFEAEFADGLGVHRSFEHLGPREHRTLTMRQIAMPPGGPTSDQAGRSASIRYSDERRIARYEQQYGFYLRTLSDGTHVPLPSAGAVAEPRRIR